MSVLCWDFDGTLVWAPKLWTRSVYAALKAENPSTKMKIRDVRVRMAWGFPWHEPEKDYRSSTGERWWQRMNIKFYEDYLKLGVSEPIARRAAQRVREFVLRPENFLPYPDASVALRMARKKGYRQIILSNNFPELPGIVKALGLGMYLDGYVVSGVVGFEKPNPEIFAVAKRMFPDETEFVMISDNTEVDILGARAAGMKTTLVHQVANLEADEWAEELSELKFLFGE